MSNLLSFNADSMPIYPDYVMPPQYNPITSLTGTMVAVVLLIGLAGLAYIIIRAVISGAKNSDAFESSKRGYYYLMSFISLGVLYFFTSDLMRVLLSYQSAGDRLHVQQLPNYFAQEIALRAAFIIVALPLYLFHWIHAVKQNTTETPETHAYVIKERKNYCHTILAFASTILILAGGIFVYDCLLLLLGTDSMSLSKFSAPFSYTVTALAIWLYHFTVLRDAKV